MQGLLFVCTWEMRHSPLFETVKARFGFDAHVCIPKTFMYPYKTKLSKSSVCALCGDCVWLGLKGDQKEKKKENQTGKCRA